MMTRDFRSCHCYSYGYCSTFMMLCHCDYCCCGDNFAYVYTDKLHNSEPFTTFRWRAAEIHRFHAS